MKGLESGDFLGVNRFEDFTLAAVISEAFVKPFLRDLVSLGTREKSIIHPDISG